MRIETYRHILKYIPSLKLDLEKGVILNRNAKCKSNGYKVINIGGKTISEHQIFAVALWGEKCINMTVNHKNENKTDNSKENLELLTNAENTRYSRGKDIIAINIETKEKSKFNSLRIAGKNLGLSHSEIRQVLNGKSRYATGKDGKYIFQDV